MHQTIIEKLEQAYPGTSRQSLRKWLKHGRVQLNNAIVIKATTLVKDSDSVVVGKKDMRNLPFEVLFEDEFIIVVLKPANFLSVASLDPTEPNVHKLLKKELNNPNIAPLHRLDKEVFGPLIFIKSQKHFDQFKNLFIKREIQREYHAIVEKALDQTKGTVVSYLREGKGYIMQSSQNSDQGKKAITHFEVLNQNEFYAHIKLKLETGRKNQIRVHLASLGHPIVGDSKYGSREEYLKGIALYAQRLTFVHPITKKSMEFSSPVPKPFQKLLKEVNLFFCS